MVGAVDSILSGVESVDGVVLADGPEDLVDGVVLAVGAADSVAEVARLRALRLGLPIILLRKSAVGDGDSLLGGLLKFAGNLLDHPL